MKVCYFDFKLNEGPPCEDQLERSVSMLAEENGMLFLFERLPSYMARDFQDQYTHLFIEPEISEIRGLREWIPELDKPTVLVGGNDQKVKLLEKIIGQHDHVIYTARMEPIKVIGLLQNYPT